MGKPEDVTSKDEHGTINNIADFEIELTRDKRQDNGTVNTNQDHKLFKRYIVDQSANSTETETSSLLNIADEAVWHANAVLCIKKKLCCVHLNRVAKAVHRDGNLAYCDVCLIDRVATITYRDVDFICRDVSCIFRDANFIRRDVSK